MRSIRGITVYRKTVDDETRCIHYKGATDIIAIRFKCCDRWYPCYECHAQNVDHPAQVWPRSDFETQVVLCGVCGYQLTIDEYLSCNSTCPDCSAKFNPGCAKHYHFYFET